MQDKKKIHRGGQSRGLEYKQHVGSESMAKAGLRIRVKGDARNYDHVEKNVCIGEEGRGRNPGKERGGAATGRRGIHDLFRKERRGEKVITRARDE